MQRRKSNIAAGPEVHTRHVAHPEDEEEVVMVEAEEADCESANGEAVSQSVARLKEMSTTSFNRPLKLQLVVGGLDQKNERLVGRVVHALCPPLTAADFGQVVAAITTWRNGKNQLVFPQRLRDVSGRIREDLNEAFAKAREASATASPAVVWALPEVFSQKTLSSNPVFKTIVAAFTDITGVDFPSIPFTVLGMIEFGEIMGVCRDTFGNLTCA